MILRDFLKINGPPLLMCVPFFYWLLWGGMPFWVALLFLGGALAWFEVITMAAVVFRAYNSSEKFRQWLEK